MARIDRTRINRVIELVGQGQPVYYTSPTERSYDGGRAMAATEYDYIQYDLEYHPFDMVALHDFMRGLVDAGPTRSGHRAPTVVVGMPFTGSDPAEVRANAWMVRHALATGVHGILLPHCESPEAAAEFVRAARFPVNRIGVGDRLGEGTRSHGGQFMAAPIWGVTEREYVALADPWPLNPGGELIVGLKVENRRAAARAADTLTVPGITFAEWGPSDMAMSHGYVRDPEADFPPEMLAARRLVFDAARRSGVQLLDGFSTRNVAERIREGVLFANGSPEVVREGRRIAGRTTPW